MPRINLRDRIKQGPFFLDGAMGTQLIAHGIDVGKCNDFLNIESPNTILEIHRAYFEAGSDAVLTNTFGANRYALARHGLAEQVAEVNIAGAQLARKAAGQDRYVLGDIGPSGDFLQPLGTLKPEQLMEAFAEQARALSSGGIDGFIIETITALDELTIAIEAVKSLGLDLPIFASMAFDRAGNDFKTMMGIDVKTAIAKMLSLGVNVVGFNCGTLSVDDYIELAGKYVSTTEALEKTQATGHPKGRLMVESRILIFAEPNAGKPELVDGRAVYKVSPEEFADMAQKIQSAGISIIGGCCGTTPEHISTTVKILRMITS
jgi:methionine synthase I (cobalamin-dependent)